jgi:hypothetical protein
MILLIAGVIDNTLITPSKAGLPSGNLARR